MNIDYSIIITKEEVESIDEQRYKYIKDEAHRISKLIDNTSAATKVEYIANNFRLRHISKQAYAEGIIFFKDHKNDDFLTQILLISNTIYSNTEMLIHILLTKNITYEVLSRNIFKISNLKKIALLKEEILDDSTTIIDKNLNYLCKILYKYYPYDNRNYMIAKLIDIVVNDKQLYLKLQGNNIEPQKTR